MQTRSAFLLVVFVLLALFAILNWGAIMAPTRISLGVASVEAPLGMILMGFIILLSALFLVFVVYLQSTVLIDSRRHTKELQNQRQLADQAEASRFTDLRSLLQAENAALRDRLEASRTEILDRLDGLETRLREQMEGTGNTLSAYIGELEDRVERLPLIEGPKTPPGGMV